jgi:hypothetical protein
MYAKNLQTIIRRELKKYTDCDLSVGPYQCAGVISAPEKNVGTNYPRTDDARRMAAPIQS